MSKERNPEVIRHVLDHFRETGELLPEFYLPDWVMDFTAFRGWLGDGEYVGMDGFTRMLDAWMEPYSEWTYDIERVVSRQDAEDVVVISRQRGLLRNSDSWVDMHHGFVYTFADGLIQRLRVFASPEEALEAAGLEE